MLRNGAFKHNKDALNLLYLFMRDINDFNYFGLYFKTDINKFIFHLLKNSPDEFEIEIIYKIMYVLSYSDIPFSVS